MTYWGHVDGDGTADGGCSSGVELLASDTGNGNCEAWAFLLSDIIRAQGFSTKRLGIVPAGPFPNGTTGAWMAIKKMWVKPAVNFGLQDYKWGYQFNLFEREPGKLLGQTAQGLHRQNPQTDPDKVFPIHFILEFQNVLFDPSYGNPSISGNDRLKVYEDGNIELYGITIPFNGQNRTFFKENDVSAGGASEIKATEAFDRNAE